MKRIILIIAMTLCSLGAMAQSCYWVMLTDKNGTTFDPYSYFDAKAIERYQLNGADLYDITNYPLNESYVQQIEALATENVGCSRWLNAIGVTATAEQIEAISRLPFVKKVVLIGGDMQLAGMSDQSDLSDLSDLSDDTELFLGTSSDLYITDQLMRMRGELFVAKGIDGSGLRIAVFDGGFHAVNTHQAFKHLRDNNQIIATWDFTKKQPNVYDNHTHGTMVLSCIAGKLGDRLIGLATGATFLLAKTEVDPEPFKEEIWWAQAMEWADKNGADIINSSLGYGKDRHFTFEMDGRSYVAKAANIAASKGMLVCNSAGNEGDDDRWKTIITPADADSVLAVGGINPSLTEYSHIYFSSYGPSADGRIKPNVCNFGYCVVADPHNDDETDLAAGTSFASPLTAGFCACAWQTMRDKTAMQMKRLIEQSADLYPYYDYALGYGVPQASFFTGENTRPQQPTFIFKDYGDYVLISPTQGPRVKERHGLFVRTMDDREDVVMFRLENKKGELERFFNLGIKEFYAGKSIAINKAGLVGYTLTAHVNGTTASYTLSETDRINYSQSNDDFAYYFIDSTGHVLEDEYYQYMDRTPADNKTPQWGVGQKYLSEWYVQYGIHWFFGDDNLKYSDAWNIGFRVMRNFRKWYSLGLGIEITSDIFRYKPKNTTPWDNTLQLAGFANVESKHLYFGNFNLELFQRIRLLAGGKQNKGLHWDLGVFGGLHYNEYQLRYDENQNPGRCAMQTNNYTDVEPASDFNWGLTTRIIWDQIGLYGRYRMSQPDLDLPRLELGIQLEV